eukprot:TRINITY_DN40109_c0_g1_i1.p1 TRINITY_DN40109_c0_g1~~TRINITY_DN40109_c0_g1_i1.p1  ORF type:complete len:297 (+),score=37.94 TRINITY_DN40109_c0_g1_i1:33-893(+)
MKRSKVALNHFKRKDVKNCTAVVMNPGDALYLPAGVIHEAESIGEDVSQHITIAIARHETTLGTLCLDLADPSEETEPRHASVLSKAISKNPALQQQLPLRDFVLSVDNKDLPDNYIKDVKRNLAAQVEHLPDKLKKLMSKQLASKSAWTFALRQMRKRLVLGTMQRADSCLGLISLKSPDAQRFRRMPGSWLVIESLDNRVILAVNGAGPFFLSRTWKDGARFALGIFDKSTARGNYFTLADLKASMKKPAEADSLVRFLLQHCALEVSWREPSQDRSNSKFAEL